MGWQRGQYWGWRQRAWLCDQFPIEHIGERALNTVIDGTPAAQKEQLLNHGLVKNMFQKFFLLYN